MAALGKSSQIWSHQSGHLSCIKVLSTKGGQVKFLRFFFLIPILSELFEPTLQKQAGSFGGVNGKLHRLIFNDRLNIMRKHLSSLPTIYPAEIAQKGMEVYQKISKRIERKHRGNFIAIEIESGKYFLGQTQVEAIEKAKKHFPTKIFYLMKVGFPAVVTFSGYQRPLSYGNIL